MGVVVKNAKVVWLGYFLRRIYEKSKKLGTKMIKGTEQEVWKFKTIASFGTRISDILFAYFPKNEWEKSMTRPFYGTKIMLRDNSPPYGPVDSDSIAAGAVVIAETAPEVAKRDKKKKRVVEEP
ncbi:hypothetical protein ACS0TY_020975 [Phlomoides rotata]